MAFYYIAAEIKTPCWSFFLFLQSFSTQWWKSSIRQILLLLYSKPSSSSPSCSDAKETKPLTVRSLQAFWGLALCLLSALMTSLTLPQSCRLPCHFEHAKHMCACMLNPFSHVWLFVGLWTVAHQVLCPWGSPGQNTGVGCHPSSRGTSQPRDWTQVSWVSCITRRVLYHVVPPGKPPLGSETLRFLSLGMIPSVAKVSLYRDKHMPPSSVFWAFQKVLELSMNLNWMLL